MNALVIAEHDNHTLKLATLNTVSAARLCANTVDVLVMGQGCEAVAQEAAQIQGLNQVLLAQGESLAHGLAENVAEQVLALAREYTHVLFASSAQGKNVAPRLAALLDVAQLSDISHVVDPNTFERSIYAGNAVSTVLARDPIKVITVRTTGFDATPEGAGPCPIKAVQAVADQGLSRFIRQEVAKSDRPELAGAKIIVSGGRAMGSAEKFNDVLIPLADKLGAALGASRAAVDAGYAPNDWQVGQTGKIVAPDLYVAVGISGAIQHLAGMKDSKVIVAINKDAEAPIFSVADFSLEADLFSAVPELVAKL